MNTPGMDKSSVLVVDDEAVNLHILRNFLQEDYKVYTASSARQALDILGKVAVDLVLLDIVLPDLSGHEVCRQLKQQHQTRDIPVIFVSGLDQTEDVVKGFDLGAADYVSKPFQLPVARARVRTHIQQKKMRDLLRHHAEMDALTGLANRRRLDEVLHAEWRRALRHGFDFSLILADVDFFKNYNDTYGHPAGDDCLVQVADCLRQSIHRPPDLAARYGGEEFVVLLPETPLAAALELAEKIRLLVESRQIPHSASAVGPVVTLSLGVAHTIPREDEVDGEQKLLVSADSQLYRSKQDGRNRCSGQTMIPGSSGVPDSSGTGPRENQPG